MSSASSNHLFVCDGAGYDEVYLSGHKDHDSSSEERSLSASYPSSRDEGLEKGGLQDDFLQDLDDNETPIQSIVGLMDKGNLSCYPYGRLMTLFPQ